MRRFLALLRGVNVGGKTMLKMADLKQALESDGFLSVSTYIQSGNVFFTSEATNTQMFCVQLTKSIEHHFGLHVDVVVYSKDQWQRIITNAPSWWGTDDTRKHNLLALIEPFDINKVIDAIGVLKPDIEAIEPGEGVIYQSLSLMSFGKTTSGSLARSPLYKKMTVRNYNTATKLLSLFEVGV